MKGDEEQVKKAAAAVGQDISEQKQAEIEAMLARAHKEGATPKDIMGLSDAMIEGIYAQAFRLYNTGKFENATRLFRMLTAINPSEPKYVMGLSACFHMEKDYEPAAKGYMILSVLDPTNPVAYYHASDCYIKMNDPFSAVVALEMAISCSGDKPEFKALKDRAILTRDSLKKEMEEAVKQI